MTTPNQASNANSLALASRFLHALNKLYKSLGANAALSSDIGELNVSQVRILQMAYDSPGIRADAVIERLELAPEPAKRLIVAMEQAGLLTLNRSKPGASPGLRLSGHGQQMAFQMQATQLIAMTALLNKLPSDDQFTVVKILEQLAAHDLK